MELTEREWAIVRWGVSDLIEADRGEVPDPHPTTDEIEALEARLRG